MLYRKVLNNDELIRRCCFYWMKYKGSLVFFPKDQFVKKANQIFLLGFCEEIVGAWTNLEDEDSQKLLKKGLLHANANINKKFFLLYQRRPYLHQKKSSLDELSTYCILQIYENAGCVYALQIILRHFAIFCGLFYARIFFVSLLLQWLSSILLYFMPMCQYQKYKLWPFSCHFLLNSNLQKTPMRDDNSPNGQVYG